jgi:Ca2+-binding RTX toxin-like protein
MDGEAGADEVEVNGGAGAENFTYGPGAAGHIAFQRVSPAPFSLDISNSEKLTLNANGGDDTVAGANGVGAAFLTSLNGGTGNDTITGGDSSDLITGGDDNDALAGGAGDDRLVGDRGGDTMAGGTGDDTLVWNNGDGSDQMDGQDGSDRVEVNGAVAAGDAFTAAPNGARVKFQRTNLVPFTLDIGSSEDLEMNTLGGDDTISVSNGLGGLIGVTADGGAGNDTLSGGNGPQLLRGGSGNDTFFARNGVADLVDGGAGADKAQTDALTLDQVRDVESVDATPPAPAPTAPSVLTKSVKVKKGVVSVTLKADSAFAGQAKIVTAKAIRLGKVRAQFVLARFAYSLQAGQVKTFKVKLAPGTARLASHHRLNAVVEGVGANSRLSLRF